jgi:Ras-related GTP-binding protein A/B
MEIRKSGFSAFVQGLTGNTVVMVVLSDPLIQSAIPLMNIQAAREHFERIEQIH